MQSQCFQECLSHENRNIMEKEDLVIPADKVKPLMADGKIFRSLYDFELTEKDLEVAYLELGETENVRRSSLQVLKRKLSGTPNLHHHTEDEILLRHLRLQKFDVDKAYAKLCQLYRLRRDYPEEFSLPSNLEALLSFPAAKILPYRNEDGGFIFWMDFRQFDADTFSLDNAMKLINAIGDIYSMNPGMQVNKFTGIWDMRGVTPKHCWQYLNPIKARLLLKLLQESYPWRVKQLILIHCNRLIYAAFNAGRYLLKKKIADRVTLMGSDISELHQYVNPRILPIEYGGHIEEKDCLMKEFILMNMSFMKYERSFKFMPP